MSHASQDSLGSPSDFGALPGALATLFQPRQQEKQERTKYTYAYVIEAVAYQPRESLEIVEARDEDEKDALVDALSDKYLELNRDRPVSIWINPDVSSRREL